MNYGVMPLLLDDLGNYSNISPYFLLNVVYSYARLALINVLLVRSLAVWRLKREEKKAEKVNRNEKKRTALRSAFLMQICLTSCSSPARQA